MANQSHCSLVYATQLDSQFEKLHHMAGKATCFLSQQGWWALLRFLVSGVPSHPTPLLSNLLGSQQSKECPWPASVHLPLTGENQISRGGRPPSDSVTTMTCARVSDPGQVNAHLTSISILNKSVWLCHCHRWAGAVAGKQYRPTAALLDQSLGRQMWRREVQGPQPQRRTFA